MILSERKARKKLNWGLWNIDPLFSYGQRTIWENFCDAVFKIAFLFKVSI
jgi:hypothetical protein